MGGTSLAEAERSVIEIELRRADASCPPFVVPALPAPVIVVPTTTCCDDHLDLVADPAGRSARTVLPSPDTLVKLALLIEMTVKTLKSEKQLWLRNGRSFVKDT